MPSSTRRQAPRAATSRASIQGALLPTRPEIIGAPTKILSHRQSLPLAANRGPVPICGRPLACKMRRTVLIGSLAAICPACWMRSPMTAGRDGFRDASSGHGGGIGRPLGTADCLAFWIDRSHHLLHLEQAAASAGCDLSLPADLVTPPCPSRPRRHGQDCSVG